MNSLLDPILEVISLPTWKPWVAFPTPSAGEALVFEGSGIPLKTIVHGGRLSAGEGRWGGYTKAYRLRLGTYAISFNYEVPCKGDIYTFQARVEASCIINDPISLVSNNIRNVQVVLQSEIERFLRQVGRAYEPYEGGLAEANIHASVASAQFSAGLRVTRFVVELRLNNKTREQLEALTDINYKGRHAQEIASQEIYEQKLEVMRLDHAQKIALQQQTHQLELQKLRFLHYEMLLKDDAIPSSLLLRLAEHPDDLPGVLQILQNQRQTKIALQMDALKLFLASPDMVEASDLGKARTVVLQLIDGLTHQIQGAAGQRTSITPAETPALASIDETGADELHSPTPQSE